MLQNRWVSELSGGSATLGGAGGDLRPYLQDLGHALAGGGPCFEPGSRSESGVLGGVKGLNGRS